MRTKRKKALVPEVIVHEELKANWVAKESVWSSRGVAYYFWKTCVGKHRIEVTFPFEGHKIILFGESVILKARPRDLEEAKRLAEGAVLHYTKKFLEELGHGSS